MRRAQLVAQAAVGGVHDDARGGAQQQLVVGGHQVGAAEEHAARLVDPALLGPALDHRLQLLLQVLQVAGRVLVEDDEVERQSLEAQVLVRLEQLGDERDAGGVGHPDQQDRQVAGDAELPQVALPALIAFDRLEIAQPRVARHQAAAEALELAGVFDRQAEMPQLDLAVRAGQRDGAGDGAAVVILLDQRCASSSVSAYPVVNVSRAVAPGASRIAWRRLTIGSSTGPVVFDSGVPGSRASGRSSVPPRPMNRARSVSNCVAGAAAAAAAEHVDEVLPIVARARTPHGDQRVALGHAPRLDEQIAERRVGEVGVAAAPARPPRSWSDRAGAAGAHGW